MLAREGEESPRWAGAADDAEHDAASRRVVTHPTP